MQVLDIIAIVISIISLLAVLYQNISLKITLENQIYESFISNSLEIDRLLIEYPHIRKYVYYGEKVDDSTPDIDRIMSVIEFIVDCVENIEVYKKYIPKNRRDGWMKFIFDVQNTPAYIYYIDKHGSWFEVKQ